MGNNTIVLVWRSHRTGEIQGAIFDRDDPKDAAMYETTKEQLNKAVGPGLIDLWCFTNEQHMLDCGFDVHLARLN